MGFRIKEREQQRRAKLAEEKLWLMKTEAENFKEFKFSKENAEAEFIRKLENIRTHLKNDKDAKELAKKLESEIISNSPKAEFHQNLLASVIVDLL